MKTTQIAKIGLPARLSLFLLLLFSSLMAHAQFVFTTNSDGTLNISKYNGPGGAVVIPDTTNGLKVTSIGDTAFFEISSLTAVTVGTNVALIADQAFSYSSMSSIALPASLTNIAFDSLQDCISLTNISVAPGNQDYSSGSGVLFSQDQTTLISYPEGKGGNYTVPGSVTNIAIYAFYNSIKLASVTLSSNVLSIQDYAFYDCPAITAITMDSNNLFYSSLGGVLFDKSQDTLIQYPVGNAATSYAVPATVTNIGMEAFFGSARLTNVTLGTNVVIIGAAAFEYCSALASITFPDSVALISGDAFAECASLADITIGTGVTNIQYQAFLGCPSVLNINVAAGNPAFTSVGNVLFNKTLTALVLYPAANNASSYAVPATVTNIGAYAFMDSQYLTGVNLGSNVQSIGDSAFEDCFSLTSLTLPNSVTNLGYSIFFNCFNLQTVVIGPGIGSIGFSVFAYCSSLTGVYFTGSEPAPGPDVFDGDTQAVAYYLPGTPGWSPTLDGIPTAPWLPQIVDSSVRTNVFSFYVDWAPGQSVAVEACTNLTQPIWTPLQTNMLTGNSWFFSDPSWTNYTSRFYRAISP